MSFLNVPLTAPDTYTMACSFWFKVEITDPLPLALTLIEFGNPDGPEGASAIVVFFTDDSDFIDAFLVSGDGAVTVDITSSSSPPDVETGDTGYLDISGGSPARNEWNHVFLSCDFNVNENQPPYAAVPYYIPKVRLYVNGANVMPNGSTPPVIYTVTPGNHEAGGGYVNPVTAPVTPPWTMYLINKWKIAVNGFNFGVPFIADYEQQAVQYAAMQVWFDQYIDPTPTNLAKFISVDGQLAEPSIAQEFFGRSQILLDGGKDTFPINQGGTTSTLYGEGIDVDPYPVGLDIS